MGGVNKSKKLVGYVIVRLMERPCNKYEAELKQSRNRNWNPAILMRRSIGKSQSVFLEAKTN